MTANTGNMVSASTLQSPVDLLALYLFHVVLMRKLWFGSAIWYLVIARRGSLLKMSQNMVTYVKLDHHFRPAAEQRCENCILVNRARLIVVYACDVFRCQR